MKPNIKLFLQFSLPLVLGIVMVYFAFRGQDLGAIKNELSIINYFWVFVVLVSSWISHLFRAARWKQLLDGVKQSASFWQIYHAVMVGYIANLLFPRLGEVSRCASLLKTNKIPVSTSLGTVIVERLFDMLFLLLIIIGALVLNTDILSNFIGKMVVDFAKNTSKLSVFIGLALLLSLAFFAKMVLKKNAQSPILLKIKHFINGMKAGLLSFRSLPNKTLFFLHSSLMWLFYFVLIWGCSKALPFTSHFSLNDCLLIFVMGSLGVIAPVQGGIGAYHALVAHAITSFLVYQLSNSQALAFASLSHALPLILIAVAGSISAIYVFVFNKKRKTETHVDR